MKHCISLIMLVVAVVASWAGDNRPESTESQIKAFYVAYMQNVENNPAANEALLQKHMTPEAIARLQEFAEQHDFDAVINGQDVCAHGMESLKVTPVEENCYFVTYKWDETSEPTMICVKAVDADGILRISDIIPLPLEN